MSPAIWSYSEATQVANEVASAAMELASNALDDAAVMEIGEERAGVLAKASKLVLTGPKGGSVPPDVAAEAISRAAQQLKPKVILVGATRNGREVAGRLAAKLKVGCVSEATKLALHGETLHGERSAFSGKATAKLEVPLPAVATVKVGSYPRSEEGGGKVTSLAVGPVESSIRLVETRRKVAGAVDLKTAKIIVSAGRGVKKKEDLSILQGLADEIGGALGCSRPISSDLGWLPEEHHIGLTGVTVKPDLYVAVGISGQLQHVAGMKDSKVVVAINTDRDAPIFQAADYGIVGDLYQVVPAIRSELSRRKHP